MPGIDVVNRAPARVVVFSAAIVGCSIFLAPGFSAPKAAANPVRIDRVELSGPFVTVHFDMEAFRRYTIQGTFDVPMADTNWVNLDQTPRYPFANHWVYADYRTNEHRFYRLLVD